MAQSIAETIDILDFAIGVLKDVNAAKADGSVSYIEMIQIAFKEASPAIKAVSGAADVVTELKDIDPAEAKVLAEKGVELGKQVLAFFGKSV